MAIDQGQLFKMKKAPAPLESFVQRAIKQYCNARCIYLQRINSGRIQTKTGHWVYLAEEGTPDLYVLYRGVSVWTETKRDGKEPSDAQERAHVAIAKAGGFIIVAYTIDQFIDGLKQIDALLDGFARKLGMIGPRLDALAIMKRFLEAGSS